MHPRLRHTAIGGLISLAVSLAVTAPALEVLQWDAPIVDAVADLDGNAIYAVTNTPPALVKFNLISGETRVETTLPHQASHLVMEIGDAGPSILFPYDNAVGIYDVRVSRLNVITVGDNPTDITAYPEGGLATADAFARQISLIPSIGKEQVGTVLPTESYPVRVAGGANYTAVITRSPNALNVYSRESNTLIRSEQLNELPVALRAWTRNRVLLVFNDRVEIYDIAQGVRAVLIDSTAEVLVSRTGTVFAMRGAALSVYSEDGAILHSEDLGVSGTPILLSENRVAVLNRETGTVHAPRVTPQLTQSVEREEEPKPVPVETTPEPSPTTEAPIVAQEFSRDVLVIRREPVRAPDSPEYNAEQIRGFNLEREKAASVSGKSKYTVQPGRTRLGGNRPHAPSLADKKPVSIDKAIELSTVFKPKQNSLFRVDTTKEPEINQITNLQINRERKQTVGTDGVSFNLDGALFESERFEQDDIAGTIMIEDNVRASTEVSKMTADKLFLRRYAPAEAGEQAAPEYPLVPFGYDVTLDDPLAKGSIESYQLHLTEADREFDADYVYYDSFDETGEIINPRGHSGPFYFSADRIRILGPDKYDSEDLWITTCDLEDPHYRIRLSRAALNNGALVDARNMRLQLGRADTPLYIPRLSGIRSDGTGVATLDFEAGTRSELGAYMNFAQWYEVNDNIDAAYRLYPTTKEGLGYGVDVEYNYMEDPASLFFRSRGKLDTLHTTEDRGYTHWYHRQSLGERTRLLAQWEQWYDQEFYKDFYPEEYEDRTGPRTFANVTHIRPDSILTATTSKGTHDFLSETEKLPEGTFHVLERPLAENLYLTMDSFAGNYRRVPSDFDAQRFAHSVRLSYDWNLLDGFNLVPFAEGGATHYSETLAKDESDTRWIGVLGTTAQARFSKNYGGIGKFSGFKHIIIPSVTFFGQDSSSLREDEVPRFDAVDAAPTRRRIESKVDNIVLGRNEADGETWRVARLALYQGYDFSNEAQETTDYEVDMEIRPRPWWGFRAVGEHHEIDDAPNIPGRDRDRVLSYIFYDDGNFENRWNGRLGFALTDVEGLRLNREVLYGAGYKLSSLWSVSAEHRYDLETDSIERQTYELRRRLHKWEMALRLRDRPSGTDISVIFSLVDIAGTGIRF